LGEFCTAITCKIINVNPTAKKDYHNNWLVETWYSMSECYKLYSSAKH